MPAKLTKGTIIAPLFSAAIPLICIPSLETTAGGPGTLLLFGFLAFLAILLALISFVGLLFRRSRRGSAMCLLSALIYLIAFNFSLGIGERMRMRAFVGLAERSKPLITAIRAYEKTHQRLPESLQELVPDFLPEIPKTGMGAYPEYRYKVGDTNSYGNPWVLSVFTPRGFINFDQFLYLPLTNYPTTGFGGHLERVGDWAYVHE